MDKILKKPRAVIAVFKVKDGVKELICLYRKEEDFREDINLYDGSEYFIEYSLLY